MTYIQFRAIRAGVDGRILRAESEASRLRLIAFAGDCENGEEPDEPVLLVRRLAALLTQMAPKLIYLRLDPAAPEIERRLGAGAADSAAMLLAGPDIGIMLSRAPSGQAVATAWIPDRSEEQTFYSHEPTVALCGAIALACAQALASGPEPSGSRIN